MRHARYQAELPGRELCQYAGNDQALITIYCAYRCACDDGRLQGAAESLSNRVCGRICFASSATIGVSTSGGHTTVTPTPVPYSSWRRASAMPITANFD